jgi:hypothetical protein
VQLRRRSRQWGQKKRSRARIEWDRREMVDSSRTPLNSQIDSTTVSSGPRDGSSSSEPLLLNGNETVERSAVYNLSGCVR